MPDPRAIPISCFAILWLADSPAEQSASVVDALARILAGAAQACLRWPHIYGASARIRIFRPAAFGQGAALAAATQKFDCTIDMVDAPPDILTRLCDLVVVARAEELSVAGLAPALILSQSTHGAPAFSTGRAHPLSPERRRDNDFLASAAPEEIAKAFAPPSDPKEAKKLADFLQEPSGKPVGRHAYDLLLRLIGQSLEPAGKPDLSWDGALALTARLRPGAGAPVKAIQAAYAVADPLARDYGERWRSTLVSRSMLLLLMNAVSGLIGALSPAATLVTIPIQIGVTALIFLESRLARRQCWRAKWLDYRRLAESLRVERYLVLCSAAPARTQAPDWVAWMVRRVTRAAPLADCLSEKAAPEVLKHLAEVEIAGQVAYHTSAALRFRRLDRGFRRAAIALLCLFVALGVVFAGLALTGRFGQRFRFSSAIGLTLTAAPTLYALLDGVRRDLDVVRQAERSDSLAASLKNLAEAIADLPPTAATAQAAAARAAHIMRDDVDRWRNVVEVL